MDLYKVITENKGADTVITKFYGGRCYATDIQKNFVHLHIGSGNGCAKFNRKDIDSLIELLKELSTKMDSRA